jgi:hypothetical protein
MIIIIYNNRIPQKPIWVRRNYGQPSPCGADQALTCRRYDSQSHLVVLQALALGVS